MLKPPVNGKMKGIFKAFEYFSSSFQGTTFRSPKVVLNLPVNGKIQGLFIAVEYFSGTFQGKFNFQGLLKTVQYIQVLFKPVQTL